MNRRREVDSREKGYGGNGLAVAGLVLGYIGATTFGLWLLFAIIGAVASAGV